MNTNNKTPQLTMRISWLGILNYLGAILSACWTLYLVYRTEGILYAALALLVFGFILRFGASPLFAIAASILYFHFDAGGLWLPLLAYLTAGLSFHNDLKLYRARQAGNPKQ
ncbi:MAG: hypothetical protein GC139_07590 [Sideroxydans sp.]|nr:hypothetical protein [Sideroxydans sp.]